MATYFEHLEYRPLLREKEDLLRREKTGWTLVKIAERSGIHAPYLTNVLKEKAHLSADQLFALGRVLRWEKDEIDYCQLLLELERSGSAARKAHLEAKVQKIRAEKLEAKAHLEKQVVDTPSEDLLKFFLNPFYVILHAFAGIPRFAREPNRITRCLSLNPGQVQAWLNDLVKLQFLRRTSEGFEVNRKNFHLPRESPLCGPHQALLEQTMIQHLQGLPEEEKYSFSVTFSADPKTREKIHREFLKFLKAVEGEVKVAPAEELYGMRFDLFRWSFERE
jgi:transcriptional regulator with XRE-family HTH domain